MGRHPAPSLLAAFTLLVLCSSCASVSDPRPVSSSYLQTFAAGFGYGRQTHHWTEFIYVKALRSAPDGGPLYLEATFENPQAGAPTLIAKSDSRQTTNIGVKLETGEVWGMQDRRLYTIVVRAYADKAHAELLDTLSQTLAYHDVGDPEAIMRGGRLPAGMRAAAPRGAGQ